MLRNENHALCLVVEEVIAVVCVGNDLSRIRITKKDFTFFIGGALLTIPLFNVKKRKPCFVFGGRISDRRCLRRKRFEPNSHNKKRFYFFYRWGVINYTTFQC